MIVAVAAAEFNAERRATSSRGALRTGAIAATTYPAGRGSVSPAPPASARINGPLPEDYAPPPDSHPASIEDPCARILRVHGPTDTWSSPPRWDCMRSRSRRVSSGATARLSPWLSRPATARSARPGTIRSSFSSAARRGALPGDLAWKLNLLTAAFGALALALVDRVTVTLTGSRLAGPATAVALGLSHTFWYYSVQTGVRTLNALFLALLLWLLLRWRASGARAADLVLPAAVFLLGLTNHLVLFLALPGLVFFVARDAAGPRAGDAGARAPGRARPRGRPRAPARATRAGRGGSPVVRPAADLPLRRALARLRSTSRARRASTSPTSPTSSRASRSCSGRSGCLALLRKDRTAAIALLAVAAVNGSVFVKTTEWVSLGSTKVTFYLTDYVVFAIFVGAGVAAAARRTGPLARAALVGALAVLPAATYAAAPAALGHLGLDVVRARDLPYRDEARFFLTPSKRGDDSARRFGEEVFRVARPGSIVVADFTPMAVLRYMRIVEGRRPDLLLVHSARWRRRIPVADLVASQLPARPVYLAGVGAFYYDMTGVEPAYRLERRGPLLEVVPNVPARKGEGDRVR